MFKMPQLPFMGYLLSRKGIGPTESHVEAVVRAKEPTNAEKGSAKCRVTGDGHKHWHISTEMQK